MEVRAASGYLVHVLDTKMSKRRAKHAYSVQRLLLPQQPAYFYIRSLPYENTNPQRPMLGHHPSLT